MNKVKSCKGVRIREVLTNENFRAIMYSNMDEALLGIYRHSVQYPVAVYSLIKYIELLIKDRNLTEEEAMFYYEDNIMRRAGMDDSPLFIDDTGV